MVTRATTSTFIPSIHSISQFCSRRRNLNLLMDHHPDLDMSASTSGSGLELLTYASCKSKLPSALKARLFSLKPSSQTLSRLKLKSWLSCSSSHPSAWLRVWYYHRTFFMCAIQPNIILRLDTILQLCFLLQRFASGGIFSQLLSSE